jgi:8-oxo-dGTP pyrophosphatase MutT (NUDIX family)
LRKFKKKSKQKVQVWVVHRTANQTSDGTKFLLLKVIRKRGSGWHPITGGVDAADRSLLAAAKREFREETGIRSEQQKWVNLKFHFSFVGRFGPAQEHAFMVLLSGRKPSVTLDPTEHTAYEWATEKQVKQRLSRRPLQRECFDLVLDRLLRQLP